ncbi:hypothetical protein COB55_04135 [Candidatus Wolfebacteria bacterium]|nr:MAG: hypothetical protein COB55_04135 [Candidatus Wolfebacteria bacterium]
MEEKMNELKPSVVSEKSKTQGELVFEELVRKLFTGDIGKRIMERFTAVKDDSARTGAIFLNLSGEWAYLALHHRVGQLPTGEHYEVGTILEVNSLEQASNFVAQSIRDCPNMRDCEYSVISPEQLVELLGPDMEVNLC